MSRSIGLSTKPHCNLLLFEALAVTLAGAFLIKFSVEYGGRLAAFSPAVWIYLPLAIISIRQLPMRGHGFALSDWLAGSKRFLLSALIVLALPAASLYAYGWIAGEPTVLIPGRLGISEAADQLLLIAIPEELFFRGYLQARLTAWSKASAIANPACPILLTAFLFALAHAAADPSWIRAAVLFPGIAMSWLRWRSGGLLAPVGFHWLANLIALSYMGY